MHVKDPIDMDVVASINMVMGNFIEDGGVGSLKNELSIVLGK